MPNPGTKNAALRAKAKELAELPNGEPQIIVLLEVHIARGMDDMVLLVAYGNALRTVGRVSEAVALLQPLFEASKSKRARAEVALTLAMATETAMPAEAEQWFARYIELTPEVPGWGWILRGANLAKLERFEAAIECYNTALGCTELDRDEAYLNLALVHRAMGNYNEACVCLNRMQMVSPSARARDLLAGMQDLEAIRQYGQGLLGD